MKGFSKPTPSYAPGTPPPSPYDRARQEWDNRIGSARAQAHNWRTMAFGCLLLSFGLAGGLVWQSQKDQHPPYIVEVDPSGEVRKVSLPQDQYRITDAQIASHLVDFVMWTRSKSTDPIVIRQNWLNAYKFVTPKSKTTLDAYASQDKPFEGIGTVAKTVDVTNVLKQTETTFQVLWRETTYKNGANQGHQLFRGSFTIAQRPPKTDRDLYDNPLGFYIESFAWSQDFEGTASR